MVRTAFVIAVIAVTASLPARAAPPSIAVASSLRLAMPELVAAFRDATGRDVRVSYGASGSLTRQIRRGAPFQVFLAANARYPRKLIEAGLTRGTGAVYARGRIGIYAPEGSPLTADTRLADLKAKVKAGAVDRFAIANPKHAPYGVRARQALKHAGLWRPIQPALVQGENAAQAAQFAVSGSTAGGLIPASLAHAPKFRRQGSFAMLPESWHAPLKQRMVRLGGADKTATRFFRFMQGETARAILRRNGFAVPGGSG